MTRTGPRCTRRTGFRGGRSPSFARPGRVLARMPTFGPLTSGTSAATVSIRSPVRRPQRPFVPGIVAVIGPPSLTRPAGPTDGAIRDGQPEAEPDREPDQVLQRVPCLADPIQSRDAVLDPFDDQRHRERAQGDDRERPRPRDEPDEHAQRHEQQRRSGRARSRATPAGRGAGAGNRPPHHERPKNPAPLPGVNVMATMAPTVKTSMPASSGERPVRVATAGASQTPTMIASATPGTSSGVLPDQLEDRADDGDRGEGERRAARAR